MREINGEIKHRMIDISGSFPRDKQCIIRSRFGNDLAVNVSTYHVYGGRVRRKWGHLVCSLSHSRKGGWSVKPTIN
jgi:hypothetical protein